jgi:ABC-type glycerol-3-phosphate transport system permease component
MAIISIIGRRSLSVRLLIFAIYTLLTVGSVTMIYPFLLMIAGSTKAASDTPETRVVPSFLTEEASLWGRHVEGLFNESLGMMQEVHDSNSPAFDRVRTPTSPNRKLVAAWQAFLAQAKLPHYAYTIGYLQTPVSGKALPRALREMKSEMIARYNGDLARFNADFNCDFGDWNGFYVLAEDYTIRRNKLLATPMAKALIEFKARQGEGNRYYFPIEGFYRWQLLKTQYTRYIGTYNREHGTHYACWEQVHLDRRVPAGPGWTDKQRKDWEEFVRTILNLLWIRADAEAAPLYRQYLQAKYGGNIAALNRDYGTRYASFDAVPLIGEPPDEGMVLTDWEGFLQGWKDPDTGRLHILPVEMIRIHSTEFLFRDYLTDRYETIGKLNAEMGTACRDWLDVLPPQRDAHYLDFLGRTGDLRKEFVVRNYLSVFDYVVLHGRGILNTAIYCALAVLASLLVNPLAAYALSRYRPPSTYKVLLVLMLTMAFPPMVAQIPVFLMLRELNLLNTFWALILPGLANGYAIFLLKGFFDSQPKELYESAALDGAGEFRIFWQITMNLSKPILAVIALGAFTSAYSNFMFALLICQDSSMWTLMVWLYELQQNCTQGVIFASLIVAAIPIFIMFALCQNIIMRGIVVPVEK